MAQASGTNVHSLDQRRELANAARPTPTGAVPGNEPLTVVTGFLDDQRKWLTAAEDLYPLALFARRYQDVWDDQEHHEFWEASLHLWKRRSKVSTTETISEILSIGLFFRLEPVDLLSRLGYQPNDGRLQLWLDNATVRYRSFMDFATPPAQTRFPLVVTEDEEDLARSRVSPEVRLRSSAHAPPSPSTDLLSRGMLVTMAMLEERALTTAASEQDDDLAGRSAFVEAAATAIREGRSSVEWPAGFPPPFEYRKRIRRERTRSAD